MVRPTAYEESNVTRTSFWLTGQIFPVYLADILSDVVTQAISHRRYGLR
jgi:hypothetical protein